MKQVDATWHKSSQHDFAHIADCIKMLSTESASATAGHISVASQDLLAPHLTLLCAVWSFGLWLMVTISQGYLGDIMKIISCSSSHFFMSLLINNESLSDTTQGDMSL